MDGEVGGYVCLVEAFAWSWGDFHCVRMSCGVVNREREVGRLGSNGFPEHAR